MFARFGKILLVLAGVTLALVMLEGGLRLFHIEYPHFYEYDPFLGARLRPGMQGYWLKEGGRYVTINSDGLHDREHDVKKPPNTLRIAVLGDSYTEALQVDREKAFWAVMEKDLQHCPHLRGRHVEVINFGQSGFGTAHALLTLRHRVWKYSPDIVLLAFCTGNDLADNSPILNQRDTDPFFIFQGDELVLDDSRVQKLGKKWEEIKRRRNWIGEVYQWLSDNSRVFQLMEQCQKIISQKWSSGASADKGKPGGRESDPGMFAAIYQEPQSEVWQEAWRVTEALLVKMKAEVAQRGARFFVVVLTNNHQVHPQVSLHQPFTDSWEVYDLLYPDRRLQRFCLSHSIPVLLLAPLFQEYATVHQVYLHGFQHPFWSTLGFGHWNASGHSLAGQAIAGWLCPQLN